MLTADLKLFAVIALAGLIAQSAHADPKDYYHRRAPKDPFCQSLTTQATTKIGLLKAYSDFASQLYALLNLDVLGLSFQSAENLDSNSYLAGVGMRQYMYQSCTQFGGFQNAYHDPAYSVRSSRINPAYHRSVCKRLFGIDQPVDIAGTNQAYYAPMLSGATKILMTDGSQDPLTLLGITNSNGNNINPELSVLVIDGAAHCDDLGSARTTQTASVSTAKAKFAELATSWLAQ